ncbi:uncharacterized protein [Solanum lycopersicum]|uniref:uncharacterized protein n=1 Tax=Solanum lycopersicum TaxID=4081 RepID=UPI00374799A1
MLESIECYGYGETGNIKRYCPKQSYRPQVVRGRGGHGRGRQSGERGGRGNGVHQNVRSDGQMGTTTAQPGRGNGQTVSSAFASGLNLNCELLDMLIRVSTPLGESMIVEKVYRSCLVTFVGSNTHVDLVILEMVDFNVILCMTWLSPNFAIFDCSAKTVTLAKPGTDLLVWEGDYTSTPVCIISFLRAKRMVSKGCSAFMDHLRDDTT